VGWKESQNNYRRIKVKYKTSPMPPALNLLDRICNPSQVRSERIGAFSSGHWRLIQGLNFDFSLALSILIIQLCGIFIAHFFRLGESFYTNTDTHTPPHMVLWQAASRQVIKSCFFTSGVMTYVGCSE